MRVFSTISFLLIALIFGCKKNSISAFTVQPTYIQDKTSYEQVDFYTSYQRYQAFKEANLNSYSYTVVTQSWTGMTTSTLLIIKNGIVVGRSYKFYAGLSNGQQGPLTKSWDEDASNLGSHKEGAEILTLDQVYEKAANVWLKVDTKTNDTYFSTDINGLIMSCGYVPKLCADDCFMGIRISTITGATK